MTIRAHTVQAASDAWTWAFSLSIAVSAGAHFALFAIDPAMGSDGVEYGAATLEMVDMLPPEIRIPPPPEAIARPATPVVASAAVDDNITIAPTTFEAHPVHALPPPPSAAVQAEEDIRATPRFTPFTVRPELKNPAHIQRLMERNYPPLLRDAGMGGTVLMWVFIDETGTVRRTLVKETSGMLPLDEVGLKVADEMQFTPALNRDLRVPVWLEIPLVFTSR